MFEDSMQHFKKMMSEVSTAPVCSGRAVRPISSLHLTIGVMSLRDQGKIEEATKLLQELDLVDMMKEGNMEAGEQNSDSINATFKGLGAMGTLRKTSVLYMPLSDPDQRLVSLCGRLRDRFIEAGLLIDDQRPLKLHVTIVNTIYAQPGGRNGSTRSEKLRQRNDDAKTAVLKADDNHGAQMAEPAVQEEAEGSNIAEGQATLKQINQEDGKTNTTEDPAKHRSKRRQPGPEKFNASDVLEKFKDFEWASQVRLDHVAICRMGAVKVLDEHGQVVDEVYSEVAGKSLP